MTKRAYGTGSLFEKQGAWYGRWRTADGRRLTRQIGAVRPPGEADGLTRGDAEKRFRALQQAEDAKPRRAAAAERRTVDHAADSLRRRLTVDGARPSYLSNTESMQRVHISPALGTKRLEQVTRQHVEELLPLMRLRPEQEARLLALHYPVDFATAAAAFESVGIDMDTLTDRAGGSP